MAIYYVKNGGNNAASGLSDALAWETIAKVNSVAFTDGDFILFKCGSTWSEILETSDSGSAGNVITYGSYSTGANPIITAMGLVPGSKTSGNWTNNGSNRWSISLPPTMFSSDWMFVRFWFDTVEGKAAENATVSASTPWFYDYNTEILHVYATSNPASAYTSIETSHLREYAMTCGNEYITITNLDLRGGRTSLLLTGNHILVDSCDIGWDACIVGLWIAPAAGDDIEVNNCTIDTGCTMYYTYATPHACSYEGIILRGDITGLLIHDNYLKNWGHACIGLNNPNAMTVENVKIYNNYFTSPDIDYGRALNLELPTGSGSGIEVYNNILYDLPTQSQFNLNGLKFYNNIVNIVRVTFRPRGHEGINMAGYSGAYDPRNIKIWNNVFANCEDAGLGIRQGGSAKTGIEVINNIFYENLGHLDYGWWVSLMIDDTPEISDNIFKNNLFYRTGFTDIIIYDGVNHTVADFNAHNGNNGDVITGNLDGDPLFVDAAGGDFRLTYDSHARGGGINVGLTSDIVGTVWNIPPSIGAYEYVGGGGGGGGVGYGTLEITISNQMPYLPGITGTLEITISNQIISISVSTAAVSAITNTTATCGGNVTSDGGGTVTARGVCWRMNVVPNIGDSLTSNGTGTGTFTSALTGLIANRTYYVRAYATNESGTIYGAPVMFQTGNTTVPEPQNTGNFPTYRFYVYEAPTSVSYEVFPLNFLSTTITFEKDKEKIFYRKKFSGSLLFGTNSKVTDYDGVDHNRTEDWDLFWTIEQLDPDAILYLDIHRITSGVVTTYWEGFFSTTDGKFDIDRCTFEVTPTVNDEYTPILDNADIQYNILSDAYYTIPIVSCHAYIAGTIDETYDRTRRFYDPAGSNTLEFLAQKIIPGVAVVSSFFSDALNPVTSETNRMRYLAIAQKSDIIRYDSSTAATSAMISWNEMMDILWAMWQVTWTYDSTIDTIYIEHISYFGHVAGLDLTNELSTQATNKYSYIKEKMPKYEKFNFMEADNHNFVGWPIFYESSQVDQDPDTNVRTTSVPVTTDLEYIIAEHDAIADEGFVILACDASWDVLLDLGAYTSEVRLNMPLSWANLQDRFFRHNRVLIEGYMNNQFTTFITAQKTKRQECSTIVCSDFDPENEITTQLGTTYFGGAKALVESATLHPSGELNLSLLYGPPDNAASFPAAQKWVLLRQITCDHWHATFSETPTTAPTINMKYTIFESDHSSAHCFDAVGVDWDLSAVDNLTIAFCGGGIPVGGCVRFVNTIPATTWVVTFIYLKTCEC
jgi:hypothetical protein